VVDVLIVLQEMDPVRQRELIEERAAAKQAAKQDADATVLKSLLSSLDAAGVRYIVIPKAERLLAGSSALAALESFPFDAYGHLKGDRRVPTSEWRSVFTDEFVSTRRAYLAWKDQDCCIDVRLADVLPVLSDVFLDYHWDAYLFDPFGTWVVESHHDGYLSIKDAEQASSSNGG
jgi:hypothetical protein